MAITFSIWYSQYIVCPQQEIVNLLKHAGDVWSLTG